MIQNVLSAIGGVGSYGVISICLFFSVFGGAVIWSLLQKKSWLGAMAALPLQDETQARRDEGGQRHE